MSRTKEIWKPINGYEGMYEISNTGRVRSLSRETPHYQSKRGTASRKGQLLRYSYRSGYPIVTLSNNRVRTCFKVHKLVAQAFIPNPLNKPQINHKDGVKTNNHYTNLEWVTIKENIQHAERNGLTNHAKGSSIGLSKMTDELVLKLRQLKHDGASYKEMSEEYNVSTTAIRLACTGFTWKHLDKSTEFISPGHCGEEAGTNKLTNQQVLEIRAGYNDSLTYTEIGEKYGVSRRTISRIVKREIWKHI